MLLGATVELKNAKISCKTRTMAGTMVTQYVEFFVESVSGDDAVRTETLYSQHKNESTACVSVSKANVSQINTHEATLTRKNNNNSKIKSAYRNTSPSEYTSGLPVGFGWFGFGITSHQQCWMSGRFTLLVTSRFESVESFSFVYNLNKRVASFSQSSVWRILSVYRMVCNGCRQMWAVENI